ITFNGLTAQQSARLLKTMRGVWARLKTVSLKVGQKYSETHITTKSIPFMQDHLRTDNQLPPTIRLASANYDPDTNKVDVIFNVTPGPKVSVEVAGARGPKQTNCTLIPHLQESSVHPVPGA